METAKHPSPPLVSVIIPSRDCMEYLPAAIHSVMIQGVERFEIIVVDDGSTDGTWVWLQAQALHDARIKGIRLEGVGVSAARNIAIEHAEGALIAFLDADDQWPRGKLAKQIAFHIANPHIVLSFTDYVHVDPRGRDLGTCFSYWPIFRTRVRARGPGFQQLPAAAPVLFAENVVGTSTVVARRDALRKARGFDESLQSASDWDLWLKLALSGQVGFCPQVLMKYLMRPGSISSRALLRVETMAKIIERYRDAVVAISPAAVHSAQSRLATGYGEYYRSQRRYLAALKAYWQALRLAPSRRALHAVLSTGWRAAKAAASQFPGYAT